MLCAAIIQQILHTLETVYVHKPSNKILTEQQSRRQEIMWVCDKPEYTNSRSFLRMHQD